VKGFSYKTHSYLGKVEFDKEILSLIKIDIGNISLSEASTWADKIKSRKEYQWTKQLQCSRNENVKDTVEKYCEENCITSAIMEYIFRLKNDRMKLFTFGCFEYSLSLEESFKFLLHFLQDFSQPLHLIGYDRGGNGFKLIRNRDGRNKTTNLHFLWDSEIPEYFTNNFVWNTRSIKERKFQDMNEYYDFLLNILKPNKNVACDYIYGKYGDNAYIIFEEYFNEEYQRMLFENYLDLVINTFRFIYAS
jgi:hypothetical protein